MKQPRFCAVFLASLAAALLAVTTCARSSGPDDAAPGPQPGAAATSAAAVRPDPTNPPDVPGAVAVLSSTWWGSPHRGGAGARSFSTACQPGWIAVGLHGRAGDHVDRVGLVCRFLRADGTLGDEDFGRTDGGETGVSFLLTCPDGQAIAGVGGRAGDHVDRLQIVCDTLPGGLLYYSNFVGGPGGAPFTDIAPNRYFLTKLVVHSGVHLDGMWAVYNKIDP